MAVHKVDERLDELACSAKEIGKHNFVLNSCGNEACSSESDGSSTPVKSNLGEEGRISKEVEKMA